MNAVGCDEQNKKNELERGERDVGRDNDRGSRAGGEYGFEEVCQEGRHGVSLARVRGGVRQGQSKDASEMLSQSWSSNAGDFQGSAERSKRARAENK